MPSPWWNTETYTMCPIFQEMDHLGSSVFFRCEEAQNIHSDFFADEAKLVPGNREWSFELRAQNMENSFMTSAWAIVPFWHLLNLLIIRLFLFSFLVHGKQLNYLAIVRFIVYHSIPKSQWHLGPAPIVLTLPDLSSSLVHSNLSIHYWWAKKNSKVADEKTVNIVLRRTILKIFSWRHFLICICMKRSILYFLRF